MKRFLFVLALAITFSVQANAQSYKDAAGVTFCPGGAASIASVQWKHFLNSSNVIDLRAGYQFGWGPHASALFEWSFPVLADGLSIYAGPGVHCGVVNDFNGFGDSCASFGLTAAAGVEYALSKIPIALSVDWRPYLTWEPAIGDDVMFGWRGLDIGLKYCF